METCTLEFPPSQKHPLLRCFHGLLTCLLLVFAQIQVSWWGYLQQLIDVRDTCLTLNSVSLSLTVCITSTMLTHAVLVTNNLSFLYNGMCLCMLYTFKFSIIVLYSHMYFACLDVGAPSEGNACRSQREHLISWNGSDNWLWASMRVLGNELKLSAQAENALDHWASVSLAFVLQ